MTLKKIDSDALLKPMTYLGNAIGEWRVLQQLEGHMVPTAIDFDVRVGFLKSAEMLKEAAMTLSMPAAVKVIELGWDEALALLSHNRPLSSHELQRVTNYADKVLSVFVAEGTPPVKAALFG